MDAWEAIQVLETYDMSEDNEDTEFKEAIACAISALEIQEDKEIEKRLFINEKQIMEGKGKWK